MNYETKQKFTVKDLEIDDIMYDAEKDVMVRVAYINRTVTTVTYARSLNLPVDRSVKTIQILLETLEKDKLAYLVDVYGDAGDIPLLNNGKNRFRHLIKIKKQEPISWTYPAEPISWKYPVIQPYYYHYWPYYELTCTKPSSDPRYSSTSITSQPNIWSTSTKSAPSGDISSISGSGTLTPTSSSTKDTDRIIDTQKTTSGVTTTEDGYLYDFSTWVTNFFSNGKK